MDHQVIMGILKPYGDGYYVIQRNGHYVKDPTNHDSPLLVPSRLVKICDDDHETFKVSHRGFSANPEHRLREKALKQLTIHQINDSSYVGVFEREILETFPFYEGTYSLVRLDGKDK